mmetsp:Transcript_30816/g.88547  ORF Transcript_30816/g.88547 Transcript_30816/m.88547 type:complete len:400 (+) Transcript_30816:89-1288(+)
MRTTPGAPRATATETMPAPAPARQATMPKVPSLLAACLSPGNVGEYNWLCCTQEDSKSFLKRMDEGCGATWDNKDPRRAKRNASPPPAGPKLALRISYAPGVESAGARLGPFSLGDDVAVTQLEPCKGYDPMTWRQGSSGSDSSSSSSRSALLPRWGERFTAPHNFYRARVCVSDGKNGFEEYWCLLSVAAKSSDRNIENVQAAVDDSVTTASYAHRFNEHTARIHEEHSGGGGDADSVIGIRVCIPVGCYVIGGTASDICSPGEALSLSLFPFKQVQKLVFDGSEEFSELPQAFFHYCHHLSAGREVVTDIQGFEDEDGDLLIVDPVVVRPAAATVGSLLGAIVSNNTSSSANEEKLRFDTWHPRCGQLCKVFDPSRRSSQCRRACGLSVPTCGVGGA